MRMIYLVGRSTLEEKCRVCECCTNSDKVYLEDLAKNIWQTRKNLQRAIKHLAQWVKNLSPQFGGMQSLL